MASQEDQESPSLRVPSAPDGEIEEYLRDVYSNRIMFMDGAMGTMIQKYRFGEADYRGERFKDWEGPPLKGDNDLLCLTRPDAILEIHLKYLRAGAEIIETN